MYDATGRPRDASLAYAWYTVFLCMVAYLFSFIDRQVIALLIEPIKADLGISDTRFSLLHGLAFAIFYAVLGVPIARLADTRSRPLIIAIGIFLWSCATAVCGLARNFWQLFAARMAVGVGEAALSPAAYSMIADRFPRHLLGRALGVYSIGSFIGSGLAYLVGGVAIEHIGRLGPLALPVIGSVQPWQVTFFLVGLPGIVIAALFVLTVRDPSRRGGAANALPGHAVREVGDWIRRHRRTFLAHYVGFGLLAMAMYALVSWAPAFLMRAHGMTPREVGLTLGAIVMLANTAGVLSSGWLTDLLTRHGRADAALRAGVVGGLGVTVPGACLAFMPDRTSTLAMLAAAMYFGSYPMATSAVALQRMAPDRMRAQVTALFFLFMTFLGIAGGSTVVALCTDYLFADERAVGRSMALVSALAGAAGAVLLARGCAPFRDTVGAVARGGAPA
jgi:MFS family permease